MESWKDYLRWTILNQATAYLGEDLEEANFAFYGKTLKGLESMQPRQERILKMVNGTLGEALGKLYVDAYFPPRAKQKAIDVWCKTSSKHLMTASVRWSGCRHHKRKGIEKTEHVHRQDRLPRQMEGLQPVAGKKLR
ncbi:MAG: hypothetical protein IPK76_23175 [Lewinellaceae bacterium]|nr:hypothetical protein [Lewinellaceae bacterium]